MMDSVATEALRSQGQANIARVALPVPLPTLFDYVLPPSMQPVAQPGARVVVPFGRRRLVGVVVECSAESCLTSTQLKAVTAVLDKHPLLTRALLSLLQWVSDYYHAPVGECVLLALPPALRQERSADLATESVYELSSQGKQSALTRCQRAPKQQQVVSYLLENGALTDSVRREQGFAVTALKALLQKGDVEKRQEVVTLALSASPPMAPPLLTAAQSAAVAAMTAAPTKAAGGFVPWVLQGVTGSGKTEVYFRVIEHCLSQQKSVLMLVPEITLTPQTVQRFKQRFAVPMVVLHSSVSDERRAQAWLQAQRGRVAIVIGTRSAVFTPMPDLGLLILDEEHDQSWKQQTGVRYSARDVALVRAQRLAIPIVLGSATPSLETLHQVQRQRHRHLLLPDRVNSLPMPSLQLVDCRKQRLKHGLSELVLREMRRVLAEQKQVLVFLNRRGFAPAVRCPSCGWVAECPRCDVPLVYHQHRQRYWCHHCDHHQPASKICGHCQYDGVVPLGAGTERLEQYLAECFSDVPVRRFDRDTTKRQGSMAELLDLVHQGGAQILLGTQMLAKGHHFPDVQLAVIVDVDTGLFSVDFRATERMGQLIVQVAGRAGREQRGLVMMQTHHPEHPLLQPLLQHDYAAFSHLVMQQRQEAGLPPYAHMVLFTAESRQATRAQTCLRRISQAVPGVRCWGPIPAPMAKRDHWYRFQLLCCAAQRRDLHQAVHDMQALWRAQDDGRVRVYVDVDPQDVM